MKWKRSRKAQQESKNKDNHNNNNEEKQPRERASGSANQSSGYKNGASEKVITNLNGNNFHFSKNIESNSHLPSHPALLHQRHLENLPGSSKDMNPDDNYINRSQTFNEAEDMIWRIV